MDKEARTSFRWVGWTGLGVTWAVGSTTRMTRGWVGTGVHHPRACRRRRMGRWRERWGCRSVLGGIQRKGDWGGLDPEQQLKIGLYQSSSRPRLFIGGVVGDCSSSRIRCHDNGLAVHDPTLRLLGLLGVNGCGQHLRLPNPEQESIDPKSLS